MTCPLAAPQTLADFTALIDRCATAVSGPNWGHTAALGALPVAILVAVLAAIVIHKENP